MTKNRDIRAYRGLTFKLQHTPLVVSTSNERNLSVVTHNTLTVAIVEDVSKRFCEIIRYVFNAAQCLMIKVLSVYAQSCSAQYLMST